MKIESEGMEMKNKISKLQPKTMGTVTRRDDARPKKLVGIYGFAEEGTINPPTF